MSHVTRPQLAIALGGIALWWQDHRTALLTHSSAAVPTRQTLDRHRHLEGAGGGTAVPLEGRLATSMT